MCLFGFNNDPNTSQINKCFYKGGVGTFTTGKGVQKMINKKGTEIKGNLSLILLNMERMNKGNTEKERKGQQGASSYKLLLPL